MLRISWLAVLGGTAWLTVTCYFLWQGYVSSQQVVAVAFIGNSFQFVNDLPRVLEHFGDGKLIQDSMLHGSLNFKTLTSKGNGMYKRWRNSTTAINEDGMIDYGACTIPQLLLGYDFRLKDGGFDQYYYDDGRNPCFQDAEYLEYAIMTRQQPLIPQQQDEGSRRRRQRQLRQLDEQAQYDYDAINGDDSVDDDRFADLRDTTTTPLRSWDFVVLNDQSLRPTNFNGKRKQSGYWLKKRYAPLLERVGATPIFYMTWAYWRDNIDMSPYVDIPTFTSQLYEGYLYYAGVMERNLPEAQRPRIAPVGLAFLVIWEENPSFWEEKLFAIDQYHPSPHGTYLAACVMYSTIHNHLPPTWTRFTTPVFERSRRMELEGDPLPLPTEEEAIYLREIAARVALHGHMPKSLILTDDDSASSGG